MVGTTSACAENTATGSAASPQSRNYLRVRGEYAMIGVATALVEELPPRARRILQPTAVRADTAGTTSACAENTWENNSVASSMRNYLRVRGEYVMRAPTNHPRGELPPRARRILMIADRVAANKGTTSACAENTANTIRPTQRRWNYLRVRGEYNKYDSSSSCSRELPPRARRILNAGKR